MTRYRVHWLTARHVASSRWPHGYQREFDTPADAQRMVAHLRAKGRRYAVAYPVEVHP